MKKEKKELLIRFDWGIKNILREKADFNILEGFLSALLHEDIKVLNLLESESNPEDETGKFNRVDILVLDSKNRQIIIEIQNTHESAYLERIVFGAAKKVVESIELGESYKNISKVITISLLYFNLGRGDDYLYYGGTTLVGVHTGHPLMVRERMETPEDLVDNHFTLKEKDIFPEYYFVNIGKFEDEINEDLDEWIYFFKNNEIKSSFKAKYIQKTREKFSILKMSPEDRKKYERYISYLVSEKDIIETAHQKGMEKGEKKGEKKGRKERENEIIAKLKKQGMSDKEIEDLLK